MNKITNPKIGFKRFCGFSLLFDNPSEKSFSTISSKGDLYKINPKISNASNLNFYITLKAVMEEINLQIIKQDYSLFKLPLYSFHVTVWDGLNDANKKMISQSYQPQLEDFLFNLPHSMTQNYLFTAIALSSSLVKSSWDVKFKFSKLSVFGSSVLVALLEPADDCSRREFEKIKNLRRKLYEKYSKEFGLTNWIDNFNPHVSLAYFGNEELGELINSKKNQLTNIIANKIQGSILEFNSISLYGFIDMETFFKFKQSKLKNHIKTEHKVMMQ